MSDLLQNLQIKKSEKLSPNNIKERLNLHVKRRLQQETSSYVNKCLNLSAIIEQSTKLKVLSKPRKLYQKKNEKVNFKQSRMSNDTSAGSMIQKSKLQKSKLPVTSNITVTNIADDSNQQSKHHKGYISGNGESEYNDDINEAEAKTYGVTRDKDKFPDLLGMVLNVQKRELFYDPEVQKFLKKVMDAFKS